MATEQDAGFFHGLGSRLIQNILQAFYLSRKSLRAPCLSQAGAGLTQVRVRGGCSSGSSRWSRSIVKGEQNSRLKREGSSKVFATILPEIPHRGTVKLTLHS